MEEIFSNSYLRCQKGNLHMEELSNKICLEKDCDLQLICDICIYDFHKNHKFIPLKKLHMKCMPFIQNRKENKKFGDFLKLLNDKKTRSLNNFDSFFENLSIKLREFRKLIVNIFEDLKHFAENFSIDEQKLNDKFGIILGNIKVNNNIEIKEAIKSLKTLIIYQENISMKTTPSKYILEESLFFHENNIKETLNNLSKEILNLIDSQKKSLFDNPLELLVNKLEINVCEYRFDSNLCHSKFQIEDRGHLIYSKSSSEWYISLLNEGFQKNKTTIFGLKFLDSVSNILIGVVCLNFIKNSNFIFTNSLSNINNGWYMLKSDKYSYSHHESAKNDKKSNFNFEINDKIFICFNYFQKTLSFVKKDQKSNEILSFEFDLEPEIIDCLCPAICIGSKDPKIEIISKYELFKAGSYFF